MLIKDQCASARIKQATSARCLRANPSCARPLERHRCDEGLFPLEEAAWRMAQLPGLLGGSTTLRGAIIKAGNRPAVLVEGAWTYRLPAPVGLEFLRRSRALPETIKAVARRAQVGQLPRNVACCAAVLRCDAG